MSERPQGPPLRGRNPVAGARYLRAFFRDPLGFTHDRFETYGDLYYAPSTGEHLFVTRHPDHFREILVERAGDYLKHPPGDDRGLKFFVGDGLLMADGELWRKHRRMIQPAFTAQAIHGYARHMVDAAREVPWSDGDERSIETDMMALTLRVVCRALFSHDPSGEQDDVARAMRGLQSAASMPDVFPRWMPSPVRWRATRARNTLDGVVNGFLDARAADPDPPDDLMSALMRAEDDDGSKLGREQLRMELLTLFLAGHETSSIALTWTLHLLSRHPEVEARVLDELPDREPTADDGLPYLDAVIKEAMRLYPPVYAVPRHAAVDTRLAGFDVPKGSQVVLWILHAHRDPRWWDEPMAFRPQRFLTDDPDRPRLAWMPFGAGRRMCIGAGFALLELRLVLATLLRRWRVHTVPDHPIDVAPRVTLVPKHGMRMRVTAR